MLYIIASVVLCTFYKSIVCIYISDLQYTHTLLQLLAIFTCGNLYIESETRRKKIKLIEFFKFINSILKMISRIK